MNDRQRRAEQARKDQHIYWQRARNIIALTIAVGLFGAALLWSMSDPLR